MPRRGENIHKRRDGRWEGRYIKCRIDGKAKYSSVFAKTYKEVKEKLADAIRENTNFLQNKTSTLQGNLEHLQESKNFSEISQEWLSVLKPQLKASSIVKYTNVLNSYLLPEFHSRQIVEISKGDIVRFSNSLLKSGGAKGEGLAPKTVTGIVSILKNILKYASQVKHYTVADVSDIFIRQQQKPLRVLSRLEQQKLNDYLCNKLTFSNLGILLCLYTGIRIGEVCALKWEDISFDEKSLSVHQTMQRLQTLEDGEKKTTILITTPKSNCSIRTIPIPDNIFRLISGFQCPKDAYFLTGAAQTFIEPRTMENRFKAAIRACGITDATFHTCRHTFATRCIECGFDIKSLSEILGHASVNITMNRYVHPSMELKQENMSRLSELFVVK